MARRNSAVKYGAWATCAALSAGLLLIGGKALTAQPRGEEAGGTAAVSSDAATRPYSPPVRFANEDMNLYWGNTHLHTNNSMDAVILSNTTTTPEEAFRFAMGEEIVTAFSSPIWYDPGR